MEINEITIPVPWGHIAAKTWGSPNDPPVLTIHGTLDNAGTFDLLIPQLPTCFYYICIDLPGHGKSSHLSALLVNAFDYVVVCKLIKQHFGWQTFTFMGHSLGGQVAVKYVELYPFDVDKLVLLDAMHLVPGAPEHYAKRLKNVIDGFLKFNQKVADNVPVPTYTRDEILQKIQNSRFDGGHLTEEAAEALAVRAVIPVDDRYKFGHDPLLKFYIPPPFSTNYAVEVIRGIKAACPVLLLACTQNWYTMEYQRLLIDAWSQKENCVVEYVDGSHDAHLTHPELIAPIISEFLRLRKSKL